MEVNFKELTFKGERPLVSFYPEPVFRQRAESRLLEMPTAFGENTILRNSLLSERLKDTLKMFSTSTTKESRTLNPAALTRPI